jgi:hypothetical protein
VYGVLLQTLRVNIVATPKPTVHKRSAVGNSLVADRTVVFFIHRSAHNVGFTILRCYFTDVNFLQPTVVDLATDELNNFSF